MKITALDISLASDAALTTGTAAMTIHGGTAGQTIALGATPGKQMQITDTELAIVTAAGLTVGSTNNGNLYINAIALIVLLGITLGTRLYLEAALLIAVMGFVGTVAMAKYLKRGSVIE